MISRARLQERKEVARELVDDRRGTFGAALHDPLENPDGARLSARLDALDKLEHRVEPVASDHGGEIRHAHLAIREEKRELGDLVLELVQILPDAPNEGVRRFPIEVDADALGLLPHPGPQIVARQAFERDDLSGAFHGRLEPRKILRCPRPASPLVVRVVQKYHDARRHRLLTVGDETLPTAPELFELPENEDAMVGEKRER